MMNTNRRSEDSQPDIQNDSRSLQQDELNEEALQWRSLGYLLDDPTVDPVELETEVNARLERDDTSLAEQISGDLAFLSMVAAAAKSPSKVSYRAVSLSSKSEIEVKSLGHRNTTQSVPTGRTVRPLAAKILLGTLAIAVCLLVMINVVEPERKVESMNDSTLASNSKSDWARIADAWSEVEAANYANITAEVMLEPSVAVGQAFLDLDPIDEGFAIPSNLSSDLDDDQSDIDLPDWLVSAAAGMADKSRDSNTIEIQ